MRSTRFDVPPCFVASSSAPAREFFKAHSRKNKKLTMPEIGIVRQGNRGTKVKLPGTRMATEQKGKRQKKEKRRRGVNPSNLFHHAPLTPPSSAVHALVCRRTVAKKRRTQQQPFLRSRTGDRRHAAAIHCRRSALGRRVFARPFRGVLVVRLAIPGEKKNRKKNEKE